MCIFYQLQENLWGLPHKYQLMWRQFPGVQSQCVNMIIVEGCVLRLESISLSEHDTVALMRRMFVEVRPQCDRNPISSSVAKVLIVLNFQVNFWAIQASRVFHLSQRIGVVCVATGELLDERWEFVLIATRNVPRVLTIPPTPGKNYLLPTSALLSLAFSITQWHSAH